MNNNEMLRKINKHENKDLPELREQLDNITKFNEDLIYLVYNSMSQKEINEILATKNNIKFLNGTYNIDLSSGTGLKFKSNQNIVLESNVVIQALTNDRETYRILDLTDLSNVTIEGGNIIGDVDTHVGTGEWGHGIFLYNSKNIKIKDINISKCWGDGVYLGASEKSYNENITLDNVSCSYCRRQGYSIISVLGLEMNNCKATNINGTNPQSGIDFEPNFATQKIERVRLNNFYTENVNGSGILIYSSLLSYIDIIINNHTHNGNGVAFTVDGGDDTIQQVGVIKNINPIYKNTNLTPIRLTDRTSNKCMIEIYEPYIIDCNQNNSTSPQNASAISIYRKSTATSTNKIGNVRIIKPQVVGNKMVQLLYLADLKNIGCEKIELLNPTDLTGCTNPRFTVINCTDFIIEDNFNKMVRNHDSTLNINWDEQYYSYVLRNTATTDRVSTISDNISVGSVLEFRSDGSRYYTLTGIIIRGLAISKSNQIKLSPGANIKIKKMDGDYYIVLSKNGEIVVS